MVAYNFVLDTFETIGVQVLALSTDPLTDTQALARTYRLDFPLVCELDYPSVVDKLGSYRNEDRRSFQATAFILDAKRRVTNSVYSTTNVGRLMPDEALRILG